MVTASTLLPPVVYLDELSSLQNKFAAILRSADLETPVNDCAEWTLRDLGLHLGGVYRWARQIAAGAGPKAERGEPAPGQSLEEWFCASATEVHRTLTRTPMDQDCWSFGEVRAASFWVRRLAHESAVHLFDAQHAIGDAGPYTSALAADTVSEVFDVMLPRMRRDHAGEILGPMAFVASDSDHFWLLSTGDNPNRLDVRTDSTAGALATIRADLADLALGLWGRVDRNEAWTIEGDADVADDFLSRPITP